MTFRAPHILILVGLGLTLGAQPAPAATLPAGSTAILSGAPSLFDTLPSPVDRSRLTADAVSDDGNLIAFSAESDGLAADDDDSVENVYVKNRATGAVVLVSRRTGAAGAPADADSDGAAISDDGKRVAFVSDAPLDPADTNTREDIYLRDLTTSETILVSRGGPGDLVSDQQAFDPALSADGRYVAFASSATNLDPAAASGGPLKIYRRDIVDKQTVLVSRPPGGSVPMQGEQPSINDDGTRIAFTSESDGGGDTNALRDVYVRDIPSDTRILVSRADGDGNEGNGSSYAPSIDGSGNAVAFESHANSFDNAGDPDTDPDIYRRNIAAKTTVLVSENAAGDKGHMSQAPSIDDAGMHVAFRSQGTQLDPADGAPGGDAYVKDVGSSDLQVVSRADGSAGAVANAVAFGGVAIGGSGAQVAFTLESGRILPDADPLRPMIAVRDGGETSTVARPAGAEPFRNEGGAATPAALSDDGRFAAFVSNARGLGLPEGAARAVFVRDRVTGQVTVASRADGADGAPIVPDQDMPAISADGGRVAWSVYDGPDQGIWVRDLASGRTFLASRADGATGAPGNGSSTAPALDADGDRVAFTTVSTNLGDGDTDGDSDVHVRDLSAGSTVLVSSAAGGPKGNRPSYDGDISADGSRVAFRSYATNLGDGDTDELLDVHLKDLGSGAVRLVSAAPDGTKGDGSTLNVSIDASGDRVAFATTSGNLGGGAVTRIKVLVRDFAAGSLTLASRADGAEGAVADDDSELPAIAPDGGSVAFVSKAENLGAGAAGSTGQLYVRDLSAGRTTLASRRNGTDVPVTQGVQPGELSQGGACVSFASRDTAVGAHVDQPQAYLRALGADCAPGTGQPGGDGGADGGTNGGGTNGDGSGPGRATDRTAPRITNVRLRPRVMRKGRKASVLTFRSSEAGRLTLRVKRVKPSRRRAATQRKAVRAGANRVRLAGRRLRPGTYRLTLTVRDAAGNTSKPVARRLIVRRGRA